MPLRKLTPFEEKNLATLTAFSVEISLLEPTSTGLEKSILDATGSVREHLVRSNVHDYKSQGQGEEHKVMLPALLLGKDLIIPSTASLYRPTTKKGDPRIWFKKLPSFVKANDVLALILHDDKIYGLNISQVSLDVILNEEKRGPIWDLISEISFTAEVISQELLAKMQAIARLGYLPSVIDGKADTAVGRTLEKLLGIDINSSRLPDYKGIELKSFRRKREGRQNRKTLFAQVANWELSKFKSSAEILENFGYNRGNDFKLYCTVSSRVSNAQGLQFELDSKSGHLIEKSNNAEIGEFAIWLMEDLRARLLEKHNETFWISADNKIENGLEQFHFTNVIHTRKPIISQFDILVDQGIITMDHLIKRKSTGGASEKGPLFKIDSSSLQLLFPPSKSYELLDSNKAA